MSPEHARFQNACFEAVAYASEGNYERAEQWLGLAQSELQKLTNKKDPAHNRV